ncbi:hypothetical protein, partial [Armatimonas sp.]|uniref:hypothetical protein n=1 Tax=Armatimonas sp. TaxID=1872638 RepID=UPI003751DBB2
HSGIATETPKSCRCTSNVMPNYTFPVRWAKSPILSNVGLCVKGFSKNSWVIYLDKIINRWDNQYKRIRMEEETEAATSPAVKDASAEARKEAARLMGLAKSEAKTEAARQNGQHGGRPKGTPQSPETRAKIAAAALARSAERKASQE